MSFQMLRNRVAGAAIALACLAPAGSVSAATAHAAVPRDRATGTSGSCTTSWASAVSGDWNDATKWTNGVPTSQCAAKITVNGVYTVTISGYTGSAASLTLGSGHTYGQTVEVKATDNCSTAKDAELALADGGSISTSGVIELTQGGSCAGGTPSLRTAGETLANGGLIRSEAGTHQVSDAQVDGSLDNTATGHLDIDAPVAFGDNSADGTFDNHGEIEFSGGAVLTADDGTTFINDAGGSIATETAADGGHLLMNGGTYVQGAGETNLAYPSGAPVVLVNAALRYTGSGYSAIVTHGQTTLSGDIPVGSRLRIEATDFCAGATDADVTAAASFTNEGLIFLAHDGACSGGTPSLTVEPPGVFTNQGLVRNLANAATTGLNGAFVNRGTVFLDVPMVFGARVANSTFKNHGDIGIGATLTAENGAAFTNGAGGLLNNGSGSGSGAGHLQMDGGTFTQGAGSISQTGSVPTYPTVVLDAAALRYTGGGPGTIVAQGSTSETGDVGSAQKLALESTDDCDNAADARLIPTAGFTNAGTITFTHLGSCPGGSDTLALPADAKLVNQGTLSGVAGSAAVSEQIDGTVENLGTISVAAGATVTLNGRLTNVKSATDTLSSGIYRLAGTLQYANPAFATDGITTNAAQLTLDGAGAFVDGDGANALRDLAANSGTLKLRGGAGLTTSASLANTGSIALGADSTLHVAGGYSQADAATLKVALASTGNGHGELQASGPSDLAGTLHLVQSDTATAGTVQTILDSAARNGTFSSVQVTPDDAPAPQVAYTPTGVTVTEQSAGG